MNWIRFAVTVAAVGGVSAAACAKSEQQIRLYDEALRLAIDAPDEVQAGARVEFSMNLSNASKQLVEACLGPSRSVSVQSGGRGTTSASMFDHPGCAKRFTLEPAEGLTWHETLDVPKVPVGSGGIEITIEIVDPTQCDAVGCPRTEVRASKTVTIR